MSNAKNVRKCAVCHQHALKSDMLRFVVSDGIRIDRSKAGDGRGIWVHASCLDSLNKRKVFNGVFKRNCTDEQIATILRDIYAE